MRSIDSMKKIYEAATASLYGSRENQEEISDSSAMSMPISDMYY